MRTSIRTLIRPLVGDTLPQPGPGLTTLPIVSVVSGKSETSRRRETGRISPPGYYMVFILKSNGVPSKGRIIRIC